MLIATLSLHIIAIKGCQSIRPDSCKWASLSTVAVELEKKSAIENDSASSAALSLAHVNCQRRTVASVLARRPTKTVAALRPQISHSGLFVVIEGMRCEVALLRRGEHGER